MKLFLNPHHDAAGHFRCLLLILAGARIILFRETAGDRARNGDKLNIVFSPKAKWAFDLKRSHAAWQKAEECHAKHRN